MFRLFSIFVVLSLSSLGQAGASSFFDDFFKKQMGMESPKLYALPGFADRTSKIIPNDELVGNLISLHKDRVTRGRPAVLPWADSYWPVYLGSINYRYNDPNYPDSYRAKENFEYLKRNPGSEYIPNRINELSPAEKYDLLIGQPDLGISKKAFLDDISKMDEAGDIPIWRGICHGWAAATQTGVPEPINPVTLKGALGHEITFYPSDIKALTSWIWAHGNREYNAAGSRCNISNPERDDNGRVIDKKCFDLNPMAWHLVVTNRIGYQKKNIIFDTTLDEEVWNYSVYDYEISYFNPQTGKDEFKLNDAWVDLAEFTNDPFASYRSSYVKKLVGIKMKIRHLAATEPHDRVHGAPPIEEIEYIYDLELDGGYNIIGGEWHSEDHPDFIWSVKDGEKPLTESDRNLTLSDWKPSDRQVPQNWLEGAKTEAEKGLPLLLIVERLNELSQ